MPPKPGTKPPSGRRNTRSAEKEQKTVDSPPVQEEMVPETPVQDDQDDQDEEGPAPAPDTPTPASKQPVSAPKQPASAPVAAPKYWAAPPKGLAKITVTDATVDGQKLPYIGFHQTIPVKSDESELLEGPYLTAWALNHITRSASLPVQKYFKDGWNVITRYLVRRRDIADDTRAKADLTLEGRKTNVDACFHQLFGREMEEPCDSCEDEHGPFTTCVVIEGACANCRYNSSAARCGFHPVGTKTPKSIKTAAKTTGGRKRPASTGGVDVEGLFQAVPAPYLRIMADALRTMAAQQEEASSNK